MQPDGLTKWLCRLHLKPCLILVTSERDLSTSWLLYWSVIGSFFLQGRAKLVSGKKFEFSTFLFSNQDKKFSKPLSNMITVFCFFSNPKNSFKISYFPSKISRNIWLSFFFPSISKYGTTNSPVLVVMLMPLKRCRTFWPDQRFFDRSASYGWWLFRFRD